MGADLGWAARAAGRGRAWWALLGVFAVNGAVLASWATRIPAVKQAAGLSTGQLGVVLLAPAVGALVAFEISGRSAARYGSARVTAVCAVAFCLLLPLVAVADSSPVALFGALLLFGAGNGALDVAMNTHGVAVEQALQRPALSGLHAGWAAGGLVGAAAGGAAAAGGLSVGRHFLVTAVLMVVCASVVARRLPLVLAGSGTATDPAGTRAAGCDASSGTGPAAPTARRPGWPAQTGVARSGWSAVLPGPVLLLGAIGFASLLAEGSAADWSATYLREGAGSTPGQAAAGYAGFCAAMLVGRLCGDSLRERFPPRRLLTGSVTVAATGLLAGLAIGGSVAGIVGFTLLGAGLAVVVPVVFAAAGGLPGERTGLPAPTALARVNALSYLGLLAGPPLVGLLSQVVELRAALLLPALLAVAVVPLAHRGRRELG